MTYDRKTEQRRMEKIIRAGLPLLFISGPKGGLSYELTLPSIAKQGSKGYIKLTKRQVKQLGLEELK